MSKFAVVDGDTVMFANAFGAAILGPPPVLSTTISGTGAKLASGAKVCVAGDEASVVLDGVLYIAGAYSVPGTGKLTIDSLAGDQTAQKLSFKNKAVILVGSTFTAKFTPTPGGQAQMPPPASTPDATPSYSGKGQFVTANKKLESA